jgi:hypothetical protein
MVPYTQHAQTALALHHSFEAQHLTRAVVLGGVRNWTAMLEGPKGTIGWHTTNATSARPARPRSGGR